MKKIIFLAILICGVLLITKCWVKYNQNKDQVPVLMYHNIVYDENYKNENDTITTSMFEKQLKYLKDNNYKTLTIDEFYCWKNSKCKIPSKSVLLTFDDGFYGVYYLAEPLLKKYNMKATAFIIGDVTKPETKPYNKDKYGTIGLDKIKSSETIEYQSHSYGMHKLENGQKKVFKMNKNQIADDIKKMKKIKDFKYISYPFNTDTDDFIEVLKDNKYKLAFRGELEKSVKNCNDYQVPRIGVSQDFNEFKSIFESKTYHNRYGNGLIRKVMITIERKLNKRIF